MAARLFLIVLVASMLLMRLPRVASAHAELTRSEPAMDSILPAAPGQVTLWFSEEPELRFSEVRVVDRTQKQVDRGDLRADPTDKLALVVGLNSLAPGTYTVSWKALSAVDGHVTRGVFVFTVGLDQTPTAPVIGGEAEGSTATPDQVATRLLNYVGLALFLGIFPFVFWILRPGLRSAAATAETAALLEHRAWRLAAIGAGLAWLGLLMALVAQTATALSVPFPQAVPSVLAVALGTRFGLLWWTRVVVLLALTVVLLLARREPTWPALLFVGMGLGLAELLAYALGSHAAAVPDSTPAAVALDWLHIVAMVAWVGGLGYLGLTAWTLVRETQGREATRVAAGLVPRFSALAATCVGTLVFTGFYQAWLDVGSLPALALTPYGRALIVKLVLILPLLAIGALNLLVLGPRLRAARQRGDQPELVRRLRQTVAGELLFALGVLVAVGVMTNVQPARQALAALGIEKSVAAEDLRVSVRVQPGNAALNRFDVLLTDRNGRPVADADRVSLRFDMLDMDMGESELVATSQGNGHYVAQGGNLAMAGRWQVTVLVRRAGRDDVRASAVAEIAPAPAPNTVPAAPQVGEASVVLGVELLVLALVAVALAVWASRRRSRIIRWAAPLAAFAVIAGGGLAVQGARAMGAANVRNPIPATAESIDRGQQIYMENCASCHGVSGRGDGPAGLSLVPRPADFRIHLQAGHTDGQLFDWISNGFPGSAMPAWKGTLSEEDRWNVLNYIQSAYGQSAYGPNPAAPSPLPAR